MARKRMIKPEFFASRPVNNLTPAAMVTYIGLWVYCDDFGRGEDDLALIKAAVWPRRAAHTEKKVAADLAAIADEQLTCRYRVAGVPLLHIPTWQEHQKVSHPTKSTLPPCPDHDPGLWDVFLNDSGDGLERFRRGSRIAPDPLQSSVVKDSSDQRSLGDLPLSQRFRDDIAARRQGLSA